MIYEQVIGLEVHSQLLTESKVFSPTSAQFGADPNSQVSPICAGMPGVLPVLNEKAAEYTIKMGLATNCKIASYSIFARKHYFYPDLPKGYQISQYENPICEHGCVEIENKDGSLKQISIVRIHLEEDAGKSIHAEGFVAKDESLVDLNRCGVCLIEIVSGPDISTPHEAYLYLHRIRQMVRYLGICDGNMEEGSLRCDANVSIRPKGQKEFGTKTELKNMNSFRNVEKAITAEIKRQTRMLENDEKIIQQTLQWDANRNEIVPMRSKEYAHDYRYFPDPDLVPLRIDETWLNEVQISLPEMPVIRRNRFMTDYALSRNHADVLTEEKDIADYFEIVAQKTKDAQKAANWLMGDVMRVLREKKIDIINLQLKPEALAELIELVKKGTISEKVAKTVFDEMIATGKSAQKIVSEKSLEQVSDTGELEKSIEDILEANQKEVERYRGGETRLMGFFVGQVMKATRGKANPKMVNEILRKKL